MVRNTKLYEKRKNFYSFKSLPKFAEILRKFPHISKAKCFSGKFETLSDRDSIKGKGQLAVPTFADGMFRNTLLFVKHRMT